MIIYFADRALNILGQASTHLPDGLTIEDDEKIEDVDTGVASFSCCVSYSKGDVINARHMAEAGNYILRKNEDETECYTIIEPEFDSEACKINIYAEDAGLDLLNVIAEPFKAHEAYPIAWYVNKWTKGSGFEIGVNEISNLSRKLTWEGETTVTERLASVATQFDHAEIAYDFEIKELKVVRKIINIYRRRGKDVDAQLRIGRHLKNIVVKESVANLATALRVTGGIPEDKEEPITLKGYTYDDGDFFVDSDGVLKSRWAKERWLRFGQKKDSSDGYLTAVYSYDTLNQKTLCARAVTKLQSLCDKEVNYDAEVIELPTGVKIGDRVNIVDKNSELYVSARILVLKTSITNNTREATFGEYLIKDSGVDDKMYELADELTNKIGYTVKSSLQQFYQSDSHTELIGGEWSNEAPVWAKGKYAWIRTLITYTNGSTSYQPSEKGVCITGNNGETGPALTVVKTEIGYQIGSSGIDVPTGVWEEKPKDVPQGKYLWSRTIVTYSDGSSTKTYNVAYSGTDGANGASVTITGKSVTYQVGTSGTTAPTGTWSSSIPATSPGQYLWTKTVVTYSDGKSTESYSVSRNGSDGAPGKDGKDGAIASNTAPTDKTKVWLDTSVKPPLLKRWDGTKWETVNDVQVGGRNLLPSSYPVHKGDTKNGYTPAYWGSTFIEFDNLIKIMQPSTTYTLRYKYRVDSFSTDGKTYNNATHGTLLLYSGVPGYSTVYIGVLHSAQEVETWKVGDVFESVKTFTTPANLHDADGSYRILYYTRRVVDSNNAYLRDDKGTFFEIKLEKGNKATDWSPAPEDVNTKIEKELIESAATLTKTAEEITLGIVAGYVTTDSLDKYKDEVNNQFIANQDGFNFNFNQLKQKLDSVDGEVTAQKQYIRLENGEIIIGKSDSPVVSKFTNDSLKFLFNGVVVAKFTDKTLEVNSVTVDTQVKFTEEREGSAADKWAIRLGANGNLNDVWIGG